MGDGPGDQLASMKEKVAARNELRGLQVKTEDELKQAAYRLRHLEACLQEVTDEIRRLEQPGILGLFGSIFGNNQDQLDQQRTDQLNLQREYDELFAKVESVAEQIEDIERRLEEFGDVETDYQTLFKAKEGAILDAKDEMAERLNDLVQCLGGAQEQVRRTELAIEAGRVILQRLSSMSKALSRVRRKRLPAIFALDPTTLLWNAAQSGGAQPMVGRVREGLEQFHQQLVNLDNGGGTDTEVEIVRLAMVMEQISRDMTGGWARGAVRDRGAAFPIEDEVRTALGLLEERLDHHRGQVDRMEQEKRALIEGE